MANGPYESIHHRVEAVLDRFRPGFIRDGGNVELLEVTPDGTVRVELQGACTTCPAQTATIQHGLAPALRSEVPEIRSIVPVSAPPGAETGPNAVDR